MAGLAFLKGNDAVGGFEGCHLLSSGLEKWRGWRKKIDGKSCGGYHVPLSLFGGECENSEMRFLLRNEYPVFGSVLLEPEIPALGGLAVLTRRLAVWQRVRNYLSTFFRWIVNAK